MTIPTVADRPSRVPRWLFRPLPAELGWPPYLWLLYVVPFVVWPLLSRGDAKELLISALLFPVFLWSYFQSFWAPPHRLLWHVALQGAVGLVLLPWNAGAVVFFVFSAAAAGRLDSDKLAWRVILLVGVVGSAWAWFMRADLYSVLPVAIMSPLIGAVTLHQERERRAVAALQQATTRNRELAATAERERIARDLHDTLGHTLTLVVLKAQVARRLADVDSERTPDAGNAAPNSALRKELRELETAARAALHDVRRAVRGYRATLDEAVMAARTLLEAADVTCDVQIALSDADASRDAVLAAVLRELCTNVARHARARRCEITVSEDSDGTTLRVADDGLGGIAVAGEGLRGVKERVHAVGGSLRIETVPHDGRKVQGSVITVILPRQTSAEIQP